MLQADALYRVKFKPLLARWFFLCFIATGMMTTAWGGQLDQTEAKVTVIDRIDEVIAQWNPKRQLYIQGNLGVAFDHLETFADWLREHGPHWTVVLMETADSETYTASDGTNYQGLDAVEHALGHGLNNLTSFSSLSNPTTGERDGAIFVLFLRERKLSYYSSEAQDSRGLGQSDWVGKLDKPAIQAMKQGGRIVDAAKDTVQSINEKLEAKIQTEIRRKAQARIAIQALALSVVLGLILAFLGLLWFLNRQRRPIKDQALQVFTEREQSVRKETDLIDILFTRNAEILGSKEKVVERGYTGTTREVSEKALNYVDDLFIMSKEVNRVLEEARSLIQPSSLWGRIANLFSSTRYQQAMSLLQGKPLRFFKRDGLPWVLREQLTEKMGLAVPLEESQIPDEVALTFDDVYQAFKRRGLDAQSSLNTIEESLTSVHERLAKLQGNFESALKREAKLDESAARDGYFSLNPGMEVFVPSVQQDLAQADQLSAFDAVQAVQGPIPAAERKLQEFDQLVDRIDAARGDLFPKLRTTTEHLKSMGYAVDWVDAALDDIGVAANACLGDTAKGSIQAQLQSVTAAIEQLGHGVERTVSLATLIRDDYEHAYAKIEASIAEAKDAIAAKLGLAPSLIFEELNRRPSDFLLRGDESLKAAKTMLGQGRFEAADSALATMQTEFQKSVSIIEASKQAVEVYAETRRNRSQELARLVERSSKLRQALDHARQRYAETAFVVDEVERQTDNDDIMPVGRIADAICTSADQLANEIRRSIELADIDHHQGFVLKAAENLGLAQQNIQDGENRLASVERHLNRLDARQQVNIEQQVASEKHVAALQSQTSDPLVMQSTLGAIDEVTKSVEQVRRELNQASRGVNPFELGRLVDSIQIKLKELDSRIVADRQGHAEAARAVVGAERQWEAAKQAVQRTQNDGVTDSRKIVELNQRISQFGNAVAQVKYGLQLPHGDWRDVDDRASRLHTEISKAAEELTAELQLASRALQAFEQAAELVYQAEQWSGRWGLRVLGSPGVRDLEQARAGLHAGNYPTVFELSNLAANAARTAIQQAEREVARRRLEEQLAVERARRAREASRARVNRDFGGGFSGSFGGGIGGLGGGFGGLGGGTGGGRSSGSSSPSAGTSSSSGNSGFSRSGW